MTVPVRHNVDSGAGRTAPSTVVVAGQDDAVQHAPFHKNESKTLAAQPVCVCCANLVGQPAWRRMYLFLAYAPHQTWLPVKLRAASCAFRLPTTNGR